MKYNVFLCKGVGGSLSRAIPDGKIPIDVFVCILAGSLCNIVNHVL